MKLILILFTLLFVNTTFANCSSEIDKSKIQINWTAFKTPSKIGVKGSFKDYSLKVNGNSINNLEATIETSSVFTKDKGRDVKIYTHFFKRMLTSDKIVAKIINWSKDSFDLQITMNKNTSIIPMNVTAKGQSINAKGIIDIFDFDLYKSLKSLNHACLDLHQGKTWNDVEIELIMELPSSCN